MHFLVHNNIITKSNKDYPTIEKRLKGDLNVTQFVTVKRKPKPSSKTREESTPPLSIRHNRSSVRMLEDDVVTRSIDRYEYKRPSRSSERWM